MQNIAYALTTLPHGTNMMKVDYTQISSRCVVLVGELSLAGRCTSQQSRNSSSALCLQRTARSPLCPSTSPTAHIFSVITDHL